VKNTKPSKDILPEMQNLRQILLKKFKLLVHDILHNRHIGAGTKIFMHLRKYNQQEEFWKANFDTFSYLHAEYFINPDVETWREREIDRAN